MGDPSKPKKVTNRKHPNRVYEVVAGGISPKCKKVFCPAFLRKTKVVPPKPGRDEDDK